MAGAPSDGEQTVAKIKNAAGLILAVTENRNWIEVFFEGDLMHTKTVDLPELQHLHRRDSPQDHGLRAPANNDLFLGSVRSSDYPRR